MQVGKFESHGVLQEFDGSFQATVACCECIVLSSSLFLVIVSYFVGKAFNKQSVNIWDVSGTAV